MREELERGAADEAFPMAPARIVSDIRSVLGDDDIVLCDTGAVKMWMARLYPTYRPNTCLISNGLATMAFSLPGAIAAKLVHPERKVLAAMGDGAFAMSMAEIETAVREGVHLVVLVWVDGGYGLIGWKQDIHFGRRSAVSLREPRLRASWRRASAPRDTRSPRPASSRRPCARRSTTTRSRSWPARSTTPRTPG